MAVTYAGAGDSGDIWTGTATSNLDMNNFSIVNVNTIQILQTATSGQALEVYRNLAAASTDSPIVCFANQNAGDDQSVLTVTTASAGTAAAAMALFTVTDAAHNQPAVHVANSGAGQCIFAVSAVGKGIEIDQNADQYGIEIQSAATTNTQYALQVVTGSGATAANIQYSGSEFARLGMHNDANGSFWFYRNLALADTAGAVVRIEQANAGDDKGALFVTSAANAAAAAPCVEISTTDAAFDYQVVKITSAGVHNGLFVVGTANAAAAQPLVKFETTDAANDTAVLDIVSDGVGSALTIMGNNNAAQVDHLVTIANSNAAFDRNLLVLTYSGTGYAQQIAHSGTNTALSVATSCDGTANAAAVSFSSTNAAFDWQVLSITQAGTAEALKVVGNADAAAAQALVKFEVTNAAFDRQVVEVINDGTENGLYVSQLGTGGSCLYCNDQSTSAEAAIKVIFNGNNAAAYIWGIDLTVDNAGAGAPGGVDMTAFTAGEPLLGIPADTNAVGNTYGRYAVYVNGVGIKYVEVFDAPA